VGQGRGSLHREASGNASGLRHSRLECHGEKMELARRLRLLVRRLHYKRIGLPTKG